MLKSYPDFEKGQIEKIFNKFSKKEREIILEYLRYRVAIKGICEITVKDIKRYICHIRYVIDKDFDRINLKDLRDFLSMLNTTQVLKEHSKNTLKADLKNFLMWKFKDWSTRFEGLKDIKYSRVGVNEEKINTKTILKKEDIENIMKHETKMFWKAFFMTQYEGGLRTKETRFLKWEDIRFNVDDEISEINIFATKTKKARPIFVKEATHYLKLLKEEQERLGIKGVYVFHSKRNINNPVDKGTISIWARNLSKISGRYFWNYLLRHSRATELYTLADENKISENTVTKFMGHNKSMKDVYCHLDSSKVKQMLKDQVYKLEELPPEQKRDFELKMETQSKELDKLKQMQEVLIRELSERKQLDIILNKLIKRPEVLKALEQKSV